MFSIYTSIYRIKNNNFIDWKSAINNFCEFAEEVWIATLPDDFQILIDYIKSLGRFGDKCNVVVCDNISLQDPLFDGKLKNAALQCCKEPFCILLDGDEILNISDKPKWIEAAAYLNSRTDADALFIPVIDLFGNEKSYKSIGFKWYIHKNNSNLCRGVVNFARKENGKISIDKSDSTELIYKDSGNLAKSIYLISPATSDSQKLASIKYMDYPFVYHLGWLDKEKRLKANSFWQPVWDNRAGHKVDNIIHDKEKLDKIEYFEHGLKLWYE